MLQVASWAVAAWSCGLCAGSGKELGEAGSAEGRRMIKARPIIDLAQLGAPDAELLGSGFSLPVHR